MRNQLSSKSTLQIRSSNFFKFTNPLLYSNSNSNIIQISKTRFKHFQDSCIHLNSANNLLKKQKFETQTIFEGEYKLTDCIFSKCNAEKINGSAIYTEFPVELKNCMISECLSSFSAIYTTTNINITFCSFMKNKGNMQAGDLTIRGQNSITLLHYNVNTQASSQLFASTYRQADGLSDLKYTNFTKNTASACVGVIEDSGGCSSYLYTIFDQNSAQIHNGCNVITKKEHTSIDFCSYIRNDHNSNEPLAAAAILAYLNSGEIILSDSIFFKNKRAGTHTLTFKYGSSVHFICCCFSSDFNNEVSIDYNFEKINNTGGLCKMHFDTLYYSKQGYIESRSFNDRKPKLIKIKFDLTRYDVFWFFISSTLSFVFTAIIVRLYKRNKIFIYSLLRKNKL
ncbi:hypothetical protein TVAG_398450 [Trichomonas vaginalis G3]|uniref:Transmembrane protein n=1 Tax=Trichomonas vaginalis (strain ATCC PRA-98 / G3) TaxID=412133 RepID=A2FSV3_TRIV3|nr:hypothetical protein TVAGG3_0460890 [Trichomonas vaginalis G3]EAX92004.1 hypothetical protein TVAG_398450 [Trichomonas vaginalis G3]KAI5514409.1 hypothetical protein TVAGG3_0460890 [Trichomonas vaginalis G3]|eukprot:XP_001304934.1 hypothetical protein [Trichomonas vaginalis G3]